MIFRYKGADTHGQTMVVPSSALRWGDWSTTTTTTTTGTTTTTTTTATTTTTTATTTVATTTTTTTTVNPYDPNLVAYWDYMHCGPHEDNHNWEWCGKWFFRCSREVAVSTETCVSGEAVLNKTYTFARVGGCQYAYFATYACKEVNATSTTTTTTASTTPITEDCRPWCAPLGSHKCGWAKCRGCSECISTSSTRTTLDPAVQCHSWCAGSPFPWSKKCKWTDCNKCSACAAAGTGAGPERRLRGAADLVV